MKFSALLISILVLSLTGCSSRETKVTKETVIEKPMAGQETKEVIIERQTSQSRSCTYGSTTYSSSSLSCQGGYQYQCVDGIWTSRNLSC